MRLVLAVVALALAGCGTTGLSPGWADLGRLPGASVYARQEAGAGAYRTAWLVTDYDHTQREGTARYRSEAVRWEADCPARKVRTAQHVRYAKPNAQGAEIEVLRTDSARPWFAATPGTMGEAAWEAACGVRPAPTTQAYAPRCAENGSCYGDVSTETGRPRTVAVEGYTRRDGTYVRGHYRSPPHD